MPPWVGDHIAASRKDAAATNVRTATTIPETMEAIARPISLLSAGEGYSVTLFSRSASSSLQQYVDADPSFFATSSGSLRFMRRALVLLLDSR